MKRYDIFLSHRKCDEEEVRKAKAEIEACGYTVFVDWIEAPEQDHSRVSPKRVQWLRDTMRRCDSVFVAVSWWSHSSKWIPWELGYMDGVIGRVFIFPLCKNWRASARNQQYLKLYKKIDREHLADSLRALEVPCGGWVPAHAAAKSSTPVKPEAVPHDLWQQYLEQWQQYAHLGFHSMKRLNLRKKGAYLVKPAGLFHPGDKLDTDRFAEQIRQNRFDPEFVTQYWTDIGDAWRRMVAQCAGVQMRH